MKIDCNVARDLMPLVIDEAASHESAELVSKHVAECADCNTYFSNLKGELPVVPTEKEQQSTTQMVSTLRKRHWMRIIRNVMIGLLIGALLAAGGLYLLRDQIFMMSATPAALEDYDLFLSQLKDGRIVMCQYYHGLNHGVSYSHEYSRVDKQTRIGYYSVNEYGSKQDVPVDQYSWIIMSKYVREGDVISYLEPIPGEPYDISMMEVQQIYKGTSGEHELIWTLGDSIPAASDELEELIAMADEYKALPRVETDDGKMGYPDEETKLRADYLFMRIGRLENKIPEWQNRDMQ